MNKPKVSVCIPIYNGERFVEETIHSVLNQTYTDYELLICDNKSTDHTIEKINGFTDERIRLIQNAENVGMVGNWNICLKEAKGEYIKLLCADDLIAPDCLKKQVELLESDDNIVLAFNASYVIDETGKVVLKRRRFRKNKVINGKKYAKKSFHKGNMYGEPSNMLFRKDKSAEAGNFKDDLCYSPDWEYWMRLSLLGNVGYIDNYLMSFRVAATSTTSNLLKKLDVLVQDDKLLLRHMRENEIFKMTKGDAFIHSLVMRLRLYAKVVFLKLVIKKEK